jgi:hypothetical protein
MTTRWVYTSEGEAPYYQDGDYIYSKEGNCRFLVSDGWGHEIRNGKPEFYAADSRVFSADGKPTYYFG